MPNPIVPGGVTDSTTTKTAEEIAAEEAAKAAKEAEDKAKAEEEARKAAEEEAKRKAEEEAAAKANEDANKETGDANKIILTTDDGDIEYELDVEGNAVKDGQIVESLAQRDADIAEIARHQAESEAITNFFRANPDIHQAALYKQTYGSLEGFANHVDWTTMSIEDKSEAQLEAIIRSAEKRKGTSDAQIDRIIRFSKADKVLNETAKESLDYLAANQKREIEEATARQEAQWKAEQDELDKAYGITYDDHGKAKVLNVPDSLYDKIVNKGTIGGLAIPTAGIKRTVNGKEQILTRKDLVKYLTAPVVEIGDSLYTQAQKDVFDMLADNETFAMVALRNLLGADISQLAAASIRQENVRRLNITSGGKPKVKVSTQGGAAKVNPNRRPVVPGGIVDSNK